MHGQLLDILESPSERYNYKRKLTLHYATIVERTFDIFEYYPTQIMNTQLTTVQIVHKLKQSQVVDLRNEIILFAGASNLEEEPVNLAN